MPVIDPTAPGEKIFESEKMKTKKIRSKKIQTFITADEIKIAAASFPTVLLIDGRKMLVDESGLIVANRFWPIGAPPRRVEIEKAVGWLSDVPESVGERFKWVSLQELKHMFEDIAISERDKRSYITHGALVVAAARQGVPLRKERSTNDHEFQVEGKFPLLWFRPIEQKIEKLRENRSIKFLD